MTASTPATTTFEAIKRKRHIVLTTFRRTGEGVGTAVWFADIAGKLYIYTGGNTGKAKRIRNSPRVTVAPSTMMGKVTGPAIEGRARILTAEEGAAANKAISRKYWILRPLNDAMNTLLGVFRGRREPANIVFLEIAPVSAG
ncbi:MAG TPA: PPOX class F420-dependent oxidoreductase [Ktedonobacterales bacterium]|nr:PPOX class F420-dependent oxidoreductase [Ktedonobacterales bacterium]